MDDDSKSVWKLLESVPDPEVPAISIVDLGIIRDVSIIAGIVTITITPTYSGCPAMHMIEESIRTALYSEGFEQVQIKTVLSPAWTTDWMSPAAKERLREFGIAPPQQTSAELLLQIGSGKLSTRPAISCPYCRSTNTKLQSEFGPTACKALYTCNGCLQPFEYFKPH